MKHLIFAVNTAFLALVISACSHRPPFHKPEIKPIECDSICHIIRNPNGVQVKIVEKDEALRQLDLPVCHFEGC